MCSSKEPGSDPEVAWEEPHAAGTADAPEESKRTGRRIRRALVAALCVAAFGTVLTILLRGDPEKHLDEARSQLDGLWLLDSQSARNARARQTEAALRLYLQKGSKNRSSARLLLAVSLVAQGRDRSLLGHEEIAKLLDQVGVSECSTRDLLTAASIFFTSDRLAEADGLVAAALERNEAEEVRQDVLRCAANIRFYLGRDDDVLRHCRELAGMDPQDDFPLRVIGGVYEQQVKWDQLIDVDRKLMALNPPDIDKVRHRLVESLTTTGRADEARKQFELLRANAPELLASSPLTEARLLHVEGKIEEALVILERVLAVTPDDSKALLLKGRIELARSKPEETIRALTRLTEIDPTDNEAHYLLGQAYARAGDDQKAKHHLAMHRRVLDLKVKLYQLERQANRNPADVEVRLQIADLYGELGWNDRVQYWKEAARSARAMRGN